MTVNPMGAFWAGASGGTRVVTKVFTASAVYQPSPGLVSLKVSCIGGGGGGGNCGNTGVIQILGGGGGGSGGYSFITLPASLVMGGVIVTVGGGGSQEAPGGTTSFGAFCIAYGGQPGQGNDAGVTGWGNAGVEAPPGVGDIAWPGQGGENGVTEAVATPLAYNAQGGMGGVVFTGAAVFPTGSGGGNPGANGYPGTGAGGMGGCINQSATDIVMDGGVGGSGICWVDEYCTVETPCRPDPCWPAFPPQWCPPGGWRDC